MLAFVGVGLFNLALKSKTEPIVLGHESFS